MRKAAAGPRSGAARVLGITDAIRFMSLMGYSGHSGPIQNLWEKQTRAPDCRAEHQGHGQGCPQLGRALAGTATSMAPTRCHHRQRDLLGASLGQQHLLRMHRYRDGDTKLICCTSLPVDIAARKVIARRNHTVQSLESIWQDLPAPASLCEQPTGRASMVSLSSLCRMVSP